MLMRSLILNLINEPVHNMLTMGWDWSEPFSASFNLTGSLQWRRHWCFVFVNTPRRRGLIYNQSINFWNPWYTVTMQLLHYHSLMLISLQNYTLFDKITFNWRSILFKQHSMRNAFHKHSTICTYTHWFHVKPALSFVLGYTSVTYSHFDCLLFLTQRKRLISPVCQRQSVCHSITCTTNINFVLFFIHRYVVIIHSVVVCTISELSMNFVCRSLIVANFACVVAAIDSHGKKCIDWTNNDTTVQYSVIFFRVPL